MTAPLIALHEAQRPAITPARLPGLGQDERDGPPLIALQNIERHGITGVAADPVFEGRVLIHDVLHHKLDADMLQIIIGRIVARVVPRRQIEGVIGRLEIGVIVEQAGKASAANGPACGRALEVHVPGHSACGRSAKCSS